MKKFFFLIQFFVIQISCTSLKSAEYDFHSFSKEEVVYNYENGVLDSSLVISRSDSNQVVFSLYGKFDDTVALYVNGRERKKWPILNEIRPVSQDSTAVNFGIVFQKGIKDTINIALLNQKKYASIFIDKSFPFCTIDRFEKKWYVNFKKQKMIKR